MSLQAKANGEASQLDREVTDEIQGFSQLEFIQKGDTHVAVVTSSTTNKVGAPRTAMQRAVVVARMWRLCQVAQQKRCASL